MIQKNLQARMRINIWYLQEINHQNIRFANEANNVGYYRLLMKVNNKKVGKIITIN